MLNTSRHEILVFNVWTAQTGCWDATVSQFADMLACVAGVWKGRGVLGARETRGAREEGGRETWKDRQPKFLHGEGMSSLLRKGTCKHQVTTEILYTFHVRLIKWWTHPFETTRRTKLSFVAHWDSGKRSSNTEVKISSNILSGTTSMSKSRNMTCLYLPNGPVHMLLRVQHTSNFLPW